MHASRPTITSTVIDLLLFVIKLHLCDGGEVVGSSKRGDGRTDGRTEGGGSEGKRTKEEDGGTERRWSHGDHTKKMTELGTEIT